MSQRDPIDLSPDKEIYRSAAVDVTYVDAIEEMVDNAIDNWTRMSRRTEDVTVEIEADGERTVVRDDTGGLGENQIHLLFALGETFQSEVPQSIGAYGIGAKKAIVRLGENATIRSRERGADVGIGFKVDKDWMNSDNWEVDPIEFPEMKEGVTEIIVESDEDVWDEERTQTLKDQLGKTYAKFLEGRVPQGGSVEITLNGEEIDAGDDIPWSFTPFDGHHPRRYEGIELNHSSLSEPVTMDVTVGHMTGQSEGLAGTDFYCQNRLVLESDTGETGGYGSTANNKIGNFTNQNNRLKVVVELNTEGDSSDLPWNGQKSDIDAYHPVTRAVHDWLRRLVKPYFQADAGKMQVGYVRPYDSESDVAANGGEIDVLDYSGRQRMGSGLEHKPDSDLREVKEMESMVRRHADRKIRYTGVDSKKKPAYDARLLAVSDGDDLSAFDVVETLEEDEGEEDGVDEPTGEFDHIDEVLADVDGAGQTRRDNLYAAGFKTRSDLENASIQDLASVDRVGVSVAESIKEAVTPADADETEEAGTETEEKRNAENQQEGEDDGEDQGSKQREESEGDQKDEGSTKQEQDKREPEKSQKDGDDVEGEQNNEQSGDQSGNHSQRELPESVVRLQLDLDSDTYEDIRRGIGVPEDADEEQVSEVLKMKLEAMFSPSVPATDD
jgi:hypothetical protein